MSVRAFEPDDVPAVRLIDKACNNHPWSLQQFAKCFQGGYTGGVKIAHGRVLVGFIIGMHSQTHVKIVNIGVIPKYRKQGCGTDLVTELLASPSLSVFDTFTMVVRETNRALLECLKHSNFRAIKVLRDEFDHPAEDGILMSWQRPQDPFYGVMT